MTAVETEYHCRLCNRALSSIHGGLFGCSHCRRHYTIEGKRGFCEQLSATESLSQAQRLTKLHPQATAQRIGQLLYEGVEGIKISNVGLQDFIIEVRRIVKLSGAADVGFSNDELMFLRDLTDEVEKLIKAAKVQHLIDSYNAEDDQSRLGSTASRSRTAQQKAGKGKPSTSSKKSKKVARPDWHKRYMNGEHKQVWKEMYEAGASIRHQPLVDEAKLVATETMVRVRHNVELLYQRLVEIGYEFDSQAKYGRMPFEPPASDVMEELERIEGKIGALPMSVRAFCENVGSVRFTGKHPSINCEYPDAFYVDLLATIWDDFDMWEAEWYEGIGPVHAHISPDYFHKSDVSGGPAYAIEVPDEFADAHVIWEPHDVSFVELLRIIFKWGGFPGFQMDFDDPPEIAIQLSKDMLPF